jgi:hypothetical protein
MTKKYSVLIAAASDCDKLREVTQNRFRMANGRLKANSNQFSVFDWKTDTRIGIASKGVQKTIFDSAESHWNKKECDILVLLFWHRYGPGTKEEYDFFENQLSNTGIGSLWVCHYNERVDPKTLETSQIDKIFKWTKKPKKNWIELGRERFSIDNYQRLSDAVESEIDLYVKSNGMKKN